VTFSPIHIGFSTPRKFNPASAVVRWFTQSKASHAFFIYFDHDWHLDMVLEAHEVGFRLIPYERFQQRNRIVAVYTPMLDINVGTARVVKEFLGRAYDFGGLFGMSIVMLGRWLRRKWRNPWDSSKAAFCSEACVLALKYSDYPKAEHLTPHEMGPQDLMDFLDREAILSSNQLIKKQSVDSGRV